MKSGDIVFSCTQRGAHHRVCSRLVKGTPRGRSISREACLVEFDLAGSEGLKAAERHQEILQVLCPGNSCLLIRTHETGSKSSWSSGLSCVRWLVVLVLGAVAWSSCRSWSSGPVLCSLPRDLFLALFLKRGYCPGNRPKDRFFDRYTLLQPGPLRFTWP